MTLDPLLGMFGLARRSGTLTYGDEAVASLCKEKKARCVFVAADAGPSTRKKAARYATGYVMGASDTPGATIPLVVLPHGREALGAAIGQGLCAVCAISDIGMAAAIVRKLAQRETSDPAQVQQWQEQARLLEEKAQRIRARKQK